MTFSVTLHAIFSNYIPSDSERMWHGDITGKIY